MLEYSQLKTITGIQQEVGNGLGCMPQLMWGIFSKSQRIFCNDFDGENMNFKLIVYPCSTATNNIGQKNNGPEYQY